MAAGPIRRRHPMIDGRRVRLSDLIDAELASAGQAVSYQQPHSRRVHKGVITDRRRIRLSDGREFSTPSGAATAVSPARAVHGWYAWRLDTDGPYLHELRRQLLQLGADKAANVDGPDGEVAREALRRRFGRLAEARRRAEADDPVTLTVRELVRLWGFDDRDRATSEQIAADLANHGLSTIPDFRAVNLDRGVTLVIVPITGENPPTGAPAGEKSGTLRAELAEEDLPEIGLTLGNLLSNDEPLVSVPPSASLEEAITIMRRNDFSQLAVLTSPFELHGAVSWRSIAQAQHSNPNASFHSTIVPAQVFDYDVRLLRVMDVLRREEFVFVRDFDGRITGIITATDVVHKYDETATPFLLIGEVDQELRRLILNAFDLVTVQRACTAAKMSAPKSFERMTMGTYQAVLNDPDCWQQLAWPLARTAFIRRLDELRKIRNTVMHFNPDPVKPADVARLRYFLDLIRSFTV